MAKYSSLNQNVWANFQVDDLAIDPGSDQTKPILQVVGGVYRSTLPTYTNGDAAILHFTSEGKLMVDTEMTLEATGVEINNIKVFSPDATAVNSKYGFAMTDIGAADGTKHWQGIGFYDIVNSKFAHARAMKGDAAANPGYHLSVAGEVVDFDTGAGTDFTPVIGILGASAGGAKTLYLVNDDSAMDATPIMLPVGGEYRAAATTYTDGDATVLQTDINGNLKVTQINTEYTDDSTGFTVATSKGNAVMAIATSDAVDAGDIGALRMTINRNLGVDISEQSLTAVKISKDANANLVTNPIFAAITDGTTGVVVETAGTKKAFNVNVTDGTNDMPTMDAAGRQGYVAITDGTDTVDVIDVGATNTGLPVGLFDAVGNRMPAMDNVARQGFVQLADGTNVVPVLTGTVKTLPTTIHDGTTAAEVLSGTHDALKTAVTDGTNIVDVVVQDAAFGTAAKGFAIFGKYQATPTTYTDNDAAPILLDANGRIVLSSDIEIGAVELKDGTTDNRGEIKAPNTAAVGMGQHVMPARYMATPPTITDTYSTPLLTDSTGNLRVNSIADVPTTLTGGNKTVALTGTAEALGASLATRSIYIRAKGSNTGNVYVGDSNVDAVTSQQLILAANDSVTMNISNRATVYVDVAVNGEGVDYLAFS